MILFAAVKRSSPSKRAGWNVQAHTKRIGLALIACLAFWLDAAGADSARRTIRLSTLAPESAEQGWGSLQIDKAVAGTPLSVAGRAFAHGLAGPH